MSNFNHLCTIMANKLENDETLLYELGDFQSIENIIIEYNRLGFLTYTSQPGKVANCFMFKSEYHRHREATKENILYTDVVRKQRAYIRGYMHIKMANFVFEKLEQDPVLFVRTTNHNRSFNFEIKFGSVNFLDDQPVLKEEIVWHEIEETKKIPDADWSFNLSLLLRRPLKEMLKIKPLSEMFDLEHQNIDCTDIVEFELIDIRWNENSYLWTQLLKTIREYQN